MKAPAYRYDKVDDKIGKENSIDSYYKISNIEYLRNTNNFIKKLSGTIATH